MEVRVVRDRPLLVVGVVTGLIALTHAWWLWTHRRLGALDPDECAYTADGLRLARLLTDDPGALPRAIGGMSTGPVVPLLSVPLLLVGPDDPRTVLLVQPVLVVVLAVAVGGIGGRLGGRGVAVASGLAAAGLPVVTASATNSYYGLAAAAALALALWALLASEGLQRRGPTLAFGVAAGVLLLTRTMTVALLPGLALAALVVWWPRRGEARAWRGPALMTGLVLVVAGPWWVVQGDGAIRYLVDYGYQERAADFGSGGPWDRFRLRLDQVGAAVGTDRAVQVLLVGVVVGLVMAVRRRGWRPEPEVLAVGVVVLGGLAALLTTTNRGVYFELPLVTALVPLAVLALAAAPWPARVAAPAPAALGAVLALACSWWLVAPGTDGVPLVSPERRVTQYEPGFQGYDGRFAATRRLDAAAAARDWWTVTERVTDELERRGRADGADVLVVGSMQLFNTGGLSLAGELGGWTPRVHGPTTDLVTDPTSGLDPTAVAGGRERPRILVLAVHEETTFPGAGGADDVLRAATVADWDVVLTVDLPVEGHVEVLLPPGRK